MAISVITGDPNSSSMISEVAMTISFSCIDYPHELKGKKKNEKKWLIAMYELTQTILPNRGISRCYAYSIYSILTTHMGT